MEITGLVVERVYAPGSKSERNAVMLETDDHTRFVLRREGGNPFVDPVLNALVGKRVTIQGRQVEGSTLIIESYELE